MANPFANAQQDRPIEPEDVLDDVEEPLDAASGSSVSDMFGPSIQTESPADQAARLRDEQERLSKAAQRSGVTISEQAPPASGPSDDGAAIDTKPVAEVFRNARQQELIGADQAQGKIGVMPHEIAPIERPVTVMHGDGQVQTYDPTGQHGVKADYLVRDASGRVRPTTKEEQDKWEKESEKAAAKQQGGTRLGAFAALINRFGGGQEARARKIASAQLAARSENDRQSQERYAAWMNRQAVDQARKSRYHMNQANRAYEAIAHNESVNHHLSALAQIERKIQDGTATQDDYNDLASHYRGIDRAVHNDPDLSAHRDEMRTHLDRMTSHHHEALRQGDKAFDQVSEQESQAFRQEILGEKDMEAMGHKFEKISNRGQSKEEDARRMEEIRKAARRVANFIKNLFSRDQQTSQTQQAQAGP